MMKLIFFIGIINLMALAGCASAVAQESTPQEGTHMEDYYLVESINLANELPIAYVDVEFFYITENDDISTITLNIPGTVKDVFATWAGLNNVQRVDLVSFHMDSNATTIDDGIATRHIPGDHFSLYLALTDSFAAYLEKENGPLLKEALKNTLYGYMRFDEFDLALFPTIPEFARFEGTVTEIITGIGPALTGDEPVQHMMSVLVEAAACEDGYIRKVNFDINDDTLLLLDADFVEIGMEVVGFYETALPATLIYPPHRQARVLVSTSGSVLVDRFDGDASLPYKEGSIIFEDGTHFEGELSDLKNRAMVVLPDKIVILFERIADDWHGGLQLTPEDLELFWASLFDPNTVQIIVNDEPIDAATPFICIDSGHTMVPVAAIAKALGYSVYGEGADVVIGQGITFTVGVDSYFIGRMAPQQLSAAPVLQGDVLFVPLPFFHNVMPHIAYISYGDIIVRNSPDMES